jgi:hypothetical protein
MKEDELHLVPPRSVFRELNPSNKVDAGVINLCGGKWAVFLVAAQIKKYNDHSYSKIS